MAMLQNAARQNAAQFYTRDPNWTVKSLTRMLRNLQTRQAIRPIMFGMIVGNTEMTTRNAAMR
jgi:hypothetical protein